MGTFITNLVIVACGFITGVLTARFLLPEGRGALAAVIFWPQLLSGIGIMSLHEATTYRVGRWSENAEEIIKTAFWLAIFLSVLVSVLGYLAIPFLLDAKRQDLWSLSRSYLLVFIPFNFIALTLLATDHGRLRFSAYNRLRLLTPLIYLMGIVLLWLAGKVTVAWVVVINALAIVIVAILTILLNGTLLFSMPVFSRAWELLKNGWSFHVVVLLTICSTQADRFVILRLWDNAMLGLYMVALNFATAGLNVVGSAFHTVMFPTLANTPRDLQALRLKEGIRRAMFLLFIVTGPLFILAPWVVPLVFGQAFKPAGVISLVLLLACSLIALKTIITRSLRGLGKGLPGAMAEFLSVGLFLVVVWPLSSRLNILGIGVALIVANIVALLYLGLYLKRRHQIELRECWGITPATARLFSKAVRDLLDNYRMGTEAR